MANEDIINAEAEEVKEIPHKPFNPLLDEDVNEKSYSKATMNIGANDPNAPINEPVFTPPPIITEEPKAQNPPPKPANPQLNDLNPKEKKNAATTAAHMVIGGYKIINKLANSAVQIGENAQKKLVKKNLIDLRVPLQLAHGVIPLGDLIQAYNEESNDAFTVSQEFEDEILPPLIREFEKRGIGASDKDMILFCLGKDLAFKLPRFVQLLNMRKDMINQMIEVTEAYRGHSAMPTQPVSAPPPPPPSNPEPMPTQPSPQPTRRDEVVEAQQLPLDDTPIPEPADNAGLIYSAPSPQTGKKRGKYKPRQKKTDL